MLKDSLTLRDIRILRDLLSIFGERRFIFADLEARLKDKGHTVKHGLANWLTRVEEAIGCDFGVERLILINRSKSGSFPTPDGTTILSVLEETLKILDERIQPLAKHPRQIIQIGLPYSLTLNLLPRVLADDQEFREFLSGSPQIDIKVVEGEPQDLERYVETGWVDFAIAPNASMDVVKRLRFYELKRVLIFNPQAPRMAKLFPFQGKSTFTDDEIWQLKKCLSEITVLIPPNSVMPGLREKFLLRPTIGRQIELPHASLRRDWATFGYGAAITYEENFSRESTEKSDELACIDLSENIGTTTLYFYFKISIQSLSVPAQKLLEAIRRIFPEPCPKTDVAES